MKSQLKIKLKFFFALAALETLSQSKRPLRSLITTLKTTFSRQFDARVVNYDRSVFVRSIDFTRVSLIKDVMLVIYDFRVVCKQFYSQSASRVVNSDCKLFIRLTSPGTNCIKIFSINF